MNFFLTAGGAACGTVPEALLKTESLPHNKVESRDWKRVLQIVITRSSRSLLRGFALGDFLLWHLKSLYPDI